MKNDQSGKRVSVVLDEDTYAKFIKIKHKLEREQIELFSFTDIMAVCVDTTYKAQKHD